MMQLTCMQTRRCFEDYYKDPDMLSKVNKADNAGTMEAIEEHLRLHHVVVRAPLAYIIRRTIIVQTYGNYSRYVTPDDDMIARMLCLLPNKNKLLMEQGASSVNEHTAEYKIDIRTVYNILNQICEDTDLYSYVNQHKSKRNGRGASYAIHSRWLSTNHVNSTASEAEAAFQTSMYVLGRA